MLNCTKKTKVSNLFQYRKENGKIISVNMDVLDNN